jgi:hypothetical protein
LRIAAAGLRNIEFRHGDVQTLDGVETGFDAVVGRLILMYLADPADALRQRPRTRPGGVICMHEADLAYLWSSPQSPLWQQVRAWFLDTLARAGVEQRMGVSLHAAFRAAGLPGPEACAGGRRRGGSAGADLGLGQRDLRCRAVDGTPGRRHQHGGGAGTLAERLLAELVEHDGIMLGPPLVGAWVTVPSG